MPKPNLSERPFWEGTGDRFPAFFKAPSTLYYRDCEQNLFRTYFGSLPGARLFKTDLWDEAKNTQILIWAAAMGADVYGIDIASSIVGEASRQFAARGVGGRFVTADLRSVPFAENAFDLQHGHDRALSRVQAGRPRMPSRSQKRGAGHHRGSKLVRPFSPAPYGQPPPCLESLCLWI